VILLHLKHEKKFDLVRNSNNKQEKNKKTIVKEKIMSSGHNRIGIEQIKKWEMIFIGATHYLEPIQLHNAFNVSILPIARPSFCL
jgi:hypothetical protein